MKALRSSDTNTAQRASAETVCERREGRSFQLLDPILLACNQIGEVGHLGARLYELRATVLDWVRQSLHRGSTQMLILVSMGGEEV